MLMIFSVGVAVAKTGVKKIAEGKAKNHSKIDIEAILRARMGDLSPSEKSLAAYLLDNLRVLPFETGSRIAASVGVSEMTVTRFIRSLGFENLRDLKDKLRDSASGRDSETENRASRFQMRNSREKEVQESLRLELDAVVRAYALTATELWDEATTAIAKADTVYVVGFQAVKGLAMDFSSRLLWVRPNVIFVESLTGTFGEIITADLGKSLVLMVDVAAYAARGIKLAERLKARGVPLIVVTDKYSHWGFAYTHYVFEGRTQVKTFWDSTTSLSVILNLMIDKVAVKLGPKAKRNFETIKELGVYFEEFVDGTKFPSKGPAF